MIDLPVAPVRTPEPIAGGGDLREAARKIEQAFVLEMLKHSGVAKPREAFGGGLGEEQFASFLEEAYAEKIMDAGGFGLSEAIFKALSADHDA